MTRLFAFLLLLVPITSLAAETAVPEHMRASCRVGSGSTAGEMAYGSGAIFADDAANYYVLTNAHVAVYADCYCEFWLRGRLSNPIPARIVWRVLDRRYDLAVLELAKSSFGGFRMPVIPLAPYNTPLAPGDQVLSVGCANATWQTSWSGHIQSGGSDRIYFCPMPAPGRSGSPLFSPDGARIVGVIGWRNRDGEKDGRNTQDGAGLAMPVSVVWEGLGVRNASDTPYCPCNPCDCENCRCAPAQLPGGT